MQAVVNLCYKIFSKSFFICFFFNDTATTEIYTLSLHGRSSDLRIGPQDELSGVSDGCADGVLGGNFGVEIGGQTE